MNIFEQASRQQLRFYTPIGQLATDDLWNLPLKAARNKVSLDEVAKDLHRQLKECEETSFVEPATTTDEVLQLKFDIVKHVIGVRLAENAAAAEARYKSAEKQKLLEILARKQDASLETLSEDEIRAKIDAL